MKLYLVKCMNGQRYAGSQAQVVKMKADLVECCNAQKKSIEVEEVEVKTSKPELLELLNSLCKSSDSGLS